MKTEDGYKCERCGQIYSLDPDLDPTRFCNLCAQQILEEVFNLVPAPETNYSDKEGLRILSRVQSELYG